MNADRHYPLYEVNHYETFREMLEDLKKRYGQREAVVTYKPDGTRQSFSFVRLNDDSLAIAAALSSMGLAGCHTAVAGGNSYQYLVTMLGVVLAGGIAVTLDTEQAEDVIHRMTARAGVEAIACDEALLPIFSEEKTARRLIVLDGAADGAYSFDDLLSAGAMRARMLPAAPQTPDEKDRPSLIVFTSGTTSVQKPVILSQKNLLTNACGAAGMVFVGARVFTPLPMYHMYGLTCGVLGHLSQGRTVGLPRSLRYMMRDLVLFKPHALTAVPLVAETLYMRTRAVLKRLGEEPLARAEKYFEAYFGKKRLPMPAELFAAKKKVMGEELSLMSCGGAHLNGKVLRDMAAMGVQILEGYGITECGPMVTCNRNDAQRLGSVGLPLPDTEVSFEDGEIIVRGLGISTGYYEDEALTRENFVNGWFHTGDLGSQDSDGYVYITGRKKNLIVFKNGKKVAPEEIEQYVSGIPLIKEAIAYGASAGASDDDVQLALLVYPDPERTAHMEQYEIMRALEDEIARINLTLPAYKQIQVIKLRDVPFEKTASQKIKRNIT